MKMKKNFFNFFLAFFIALLFSCNHHNLEETSTTIQIPAEIFRQVTEISETSDMSLLLALSCKDYFERKTFSISEGNLRENGLSVTFEGIPSYEDGKVYVEFVENKRVSGDLETYYTNNLATYKCTSDFKVFPNSLISVKLELKAVPTEETYLAEFTLVQEDTEGQYKLLYPKINFTENSTLNAPLPIGTTRWRVYYYSTYYGSFGEIIDVKNGLMNYKEFISKPNENIPNPTFYLEATGEPTDKIKTPIVYYNVTERDLTDETGIANTIPMYEYLACNNIDEVQEDNDATEAIFSLSYAVSDYCFDNAGNLYVAYDDSVYKIAYDNKTGKYEEFIGNDGTALYGTFATEAQDYGIQSLAYDAGENVLYVLTSSYIYKYLNPAGTIYKNCGGYPSLIYLGEDFYIDSTSWTVHDGIIYDATVDNSDGDNYKLVLKRYKYENGVLSKDGDDISKELGISSCNETSTDLIYQDRSIYIIFKSYNRSWTTDSKGVSIGGILKYNIENNSFDESFGIKGLINEEMTIEVGNPTRAISYLAPTDDDEDFYFYGPTNFVAIMPKKLVFLDQGADVGSYDAENNDKIPSKSRIVEYDLSTNSFSSKELSSPDLYFNFSGVSF